MLKSENSIESRELPKRRRWPCRWGKIVPLLIEAGQQQRAWLNDFADDLIRIDSDLYDVLLAYQELQQRAAWPAPRSDPHF